MASSERVQSSARGTSSLVLLLLLVCGHIGPVRPRDCVRHYKRARSANWRAEALLLAHNLDINVRPT